MQKENIHSFVKSCWRIW